MKKMGNMKDHRKPVADHEPIMIIPDESSNEQYSSADDILCEPAGDSFYATDYSDSRLNVPSVKNNLASSTEGVSFTTSSRSSLGIGSMPSSKTSSMDPSLLEFPRNLVDNYTTRFSSSNFSSNTSLNGRTTHCRRTLAFDHSSGSKNELCESGVQSDKNSTDSPVMKSINEDEIVRGIEWLDSVLGGAGGCDSNAKQGPVDSSTDEYAKSVNNTNNNNASADQQRFYQLFHQHYHFMQHVHKHLMLNSDLYKRQQSATDGFCDLDKGSDHLVGSKSLFAFPPGEDNEKVSRQTCYSCQQLKKCDDFSALEMRTSNRHRSSFKRGRCSSNDEVNLVASADDGAVDGTTGGSHKQVSVSPSIARVTQKFTANNNNQNKHYAASVTLSPECITAKMSSGETEQHQKQQLQQAKAKSPGTIPDPMETVAKTREKSCSQKQVGNPASREYQPGEDELEDEDEEELVQLLKNSYSDKLDNSGHKTSSNIAIVKPSAKLRQDANLPSSFSRLAINEGKHPNGLYSIMEPTMARGNLRREGSYRKSLRALRSHVSFHEQAMSTIAGGHSSSLRYEQLCETGNMPRCYHGSNQSAHGRRSLPNSFAPCSNKAAGFRRLSVLNSNLNKNIRKSFRRPRLSLTKSHLFGHFSFSSGAEDPSTSLLGIAQRAISMAATLSGQTNQEISTQYQMSNLRFVASGPVSDGSGGMSKGQRNSTPGHQAGGMTESNAFQMNSYSNSSRMANNTSGGGGPGGGQGTAANNDNPLTQGLISGTGEMIGNDLQAGGQAANGNGGSNGSIANGDPRTRTCCFCWCCCCSCSCMQVRPNLDENKRNSPSNDMQNKLNDPFGKDDHLPTYEELRKWGESFDTLMQSGYGQRIFKEFLRSEYSDENIMFWLACEDLKQTMNPEEVEEKAHNIYEDFISMLSPKEVSLDSRVREIIDANMMEPSPHTFDEAQLQIYTLMHRDSYPRFLNSRIYKDLLNEVAGTQA